MEGCGSAPWGTVGESNKGVKAMARRRGQRVVAIPQVEIGNIVAVAGRGTAANALLLIFMLASAPMSSPERGSIAGRRC